MWGRTKHLTKSLTERPVKNPKAGIRDIGLTVGDLIGGSLGEEFRNICLIACSTKESSTSSILKWYQEIHEWINKSENKDVRDYHLDLFQKAFFKRRKGDYLEKFKPMIRILKTAKIAIPEPLSTKKNQPQPSKSKSPERSASKSAKRSKSKSPKRKKAARPKAAVIEIIEPRHEDAPKAPRPTKPALPYGWTIRVHYVSLHGLLVKILPELSSRWEGFHAAIDVGALSLDEFRIFMDKQFKLCVDLTIPIHWLLSGLYSNISLLDSTHACMVENQRDELYKELAPKVDIIREVCKKEVESRGIPTNPPNMKTSEQYLAVLSNTFRERIRMLGDVPSEAQEILKQVFDLLEDDGDASEEQVRSAVSHEAAASIQLSPSRKQSPPKPVVSKPQVEIESSSENSFSLHDN
jgi:hypothetical protein